MSTFEQNIRPISAPAGEDLTGHQWGLVKYNSNGEFVKTAEGEQAIGVLQNKPAKGEAATVAQVGSISFCKAGAPIPAGIAVTSDANGLAVPAESGQKAIGTAATSASQAGEIFSLYVGVPTGTV